MYISPKKETYLDKIPFEASASFILPSNPLLTTKLAPILNNINGSPAFMNKSEFGGDVGSGAFILPMTNYSARRNAKSELQ